MSIILMAKSDDYNQYPTTKLLCDVMSLYTSYLMDDIPYPAIMDHLHSLDTSLLPFDVDAVFEHMDRLKEDMIDERNK